ncbi:MAG TPA: nucleotidyltransferase family protein [Gammaproteobacteria bacterium]|nr:nucleotidyltransferase family protein [Gammaproteobacteria bacterium]
MDVMILAAGRGQRMGRLTAKKPKPLLEVAGKTLIEHQLQHLAAAGFHHVIINTHYRGEQIHQQLRQGQDYGLEIEYSDEKGVVLDTGGGIVKALPLLSDPFVVVNADTWADYPYAQLSITEQVLAHLILVPNPRHNPDGDFLLNKGMVFPLREDKTTPSLTFSGIGCYRKALFQNCVSRPFPLAPLLVHQAASGHVSGRLYQGLWCDVGTPERLHSLES